MSKPKLTPQQQQKAIELVKTHGLSQVAVAARYGVDRKVINDLVKRGVPYAQ